MKKMNKKGFTLVEMLVVIAIIAILVSILVPTVLGATKKAKAATDAANLRTAMAELEINLLNRGEDITKNTIYLSNSGANFTDCSSKAYTAGVKIAIYVDANGKMTAGFVANSVTASTSASAAPTWVVNLDTLAGEAGATTTAA